MADSFDAVLAELKNQGWRVDRTGDGHFKCFPADVTRVMVTIARSNDPRALKNAISFLRKSGFVWPPPEVERVVEVEVAAPAAPLARRAPNAGAFVPLETKPDWNAPLEPDMAAEPETPEDRMDRLFNELKEARTLASLATTQHGLCQQELERAQAALDAAHEEQIKFLEALKAKKAEFDAAFSAVDAEAA